MLDQVDDPEKETGSFASGLDGENVKDTVRGVSALTAGTAQAQMTSTATSVIRRPDCMPSGRFSILWERGRVDFFITGNLLLRGILRILQ
jgi:hypothetical protein